MRPRMSLEELTGPALEAYQRFKSKTGDPLTWQYMRPLELVGYTNQGNALVRWRCDYVDKVEGTICNRLRLVEVRRIYPRGSCRTCGLHGKQVDTRFRTGLRGRVYIPASKLKVLDPEGYVKWRASAHACYVRLKKSLSQNPIAKQQFRAHARAYHRAYYYRPHVKAIRQAYDRASSVTHFDDWSYSIISPQGCTYIVIGGNLASFCVTFGLNYGGVYNFIYCRKSSYYGWTQGKRFPTSEITEDQKKYIWVRPDKTKTLANSKQV